MERRPRIARSAYRVSPAVVLLSGCSLLWDERGTAERYASRDAAAPDGAVPAQDAASLAPRFSTLTNNNPDPRLLDTALIGFTTEDAERVLLRAGALVVWTSGSAEEARAGELLVEVDRAGAWTLEAVGSRSGERRALFEVPPQPDRTVPEIRELTLTPALIQAGTATPASVQRRWAVSGASTATLSAAHGRSYLVPPSGQDQVSLASGRSFVLQAFDESGASAAAQASVYWLRAEREPNEPNGMVERLAEESLEGSTVPGDRDAFTVTNYVGERVRLKLVTPSGDCAGAPALIVAGRAGEPAPPACALWEPLPWEGATAVSPNVAGEIAGAAAAAYRLLVERVPPFVGNGWLDPGEECDDGNGLPRDGCDERGRFEEGFAYQEDPASVAPPPPSDLPVLPIVPYETGSGGRALLRFEKAIPFMGRRYGAALVHSSGLVTFSPRSTLAPPPVPRFLPDVRLPFAAVAALAGAWELRSAPRPFGYVDGQRWTGVTMDLGPASTAGTARVWVAFSDAGDVTLGVERLDLDAQLQPALVAGVQAAGGRLGAEPSWCKHGCVPGGADRELYEGARARLRWKR